jgi:hypothetical protein
VKVGGGLNYVVGPMGSGKSLYAVRAIVDAVTHGRYAVTNVELVPGWEDRVARHIARTNPRARRRVRDRVQQLYVYTPELEEALRYRLPGKGEARGLFVWDEGHNDLNNRNWRQRAEKYATDRGTDRLLEWATQLRKLGFVGYLLSQHTDNTDAALRRVCNYVVRLQNQKEQTRMMGVRITPVPLFLAYWYPAHLADGRTRVQPIKVERYFLGWHRNLYDTFGLFHGLASDIGDDVIELPALAALPASVKVAGRPGLALAASPDDAVEVPPGLAHRAARWLAALLASPHSPQPDPSEGGAAPLPGTGGRPVVGISEIELSSVQTERPPLEAAVALESVALQEPRADATS